MILADYRLSEVSRGWELVSCWTRVSWRPVWCSDKEKDSQVLRVAAFSSCRWMAVQQSFRGPDMMDSKYEAGDIKMRDIKMREIQFLPSRESWSHRRDRYYILIILKTYDKLSNVEPLQTKDCGDTVEGMVSSGMCGRKKDLERLGKWE